MSSTPSANSVTSATIVDDSITGSDIANTLSMTDTTLNIRLINGERRAASG